MRRREFITLLGGAAAAWPLSASAQQPAMQVIGFLSPISATNAGIFLDAFRQGLKESGFIEGQNVRIEYRWAEGQYDRLPALAADLVRMRVAVIATMGDGVYAAKAAQPAKGSSAIPIVFALGDDPVAVGLVASLNRPGGNITGATSIGHSLGPKRVEFLRELIPSATTVGFLINPKQADDIEVRDIEQTARAGGWQLRVLPARSAEEIDAVFATIVRDRIDALIVAVDTLFFAESKRLALLAARDAVPTISPLRAFAVAGGLISFGASAPDVTRQAGVYTGRVLKGEKPADLPVVQPTKFELVINLKTAKALGLTVPQSLLVAADEVIE
jgi:putative tryptophan/tyrosine transport system substrate-binding protein